MIDPFIPVIVAGGTILLVMLVFLGVQLYITLAELRRTLVKANRVLDDAGVISDAVVKIPALLSAFLGQTGKGVMDKLLPAERKKKET